MTATHSNPAEGSSSVEGLPKSFVCSMRTLFDIMDDDHIGYVRFSEIERQWQEDGTQGLPEGVLSSLRKVTPPNGFLSFDRFCAGLKMCLLKNKGRVEAALSFNGPSTLSPTSSLEMIPPLKASSPQTSPQHYSRPLSAPLLDQEAFPKQPLTNGNLLNGLSGSRKASCSSCTLQKAEKGKLNLADYPLTNQSTEPLPTHTQQHPHSSIDVKICANKSDIRMGIGGIKCLGKCPLSIGSSSSTSAGGPPKPPRVQEGMSEHFPPQQQTRIVHNDPRMTNSLERESRADRRWNRERENTLNGSGTRKERGGSLERLLDAGGHRPTKENTYGLPLNRTGMRSALQTWFKERSKSDLQQEDNSNNFRHSNGISKRYKEKYYKEARVPPPYPSGMEMTFRGSGDGVDNHRGSSGGGNKASYVGRGAPPPPPVPSHTRSIPPPQPPITAHSNGSNLNDVKIYGKPVTMETVVAVPSNYTPGVGRGENGPPLPQTSCAAAHGLYVAPQPPQLAVHKKTSKKKEPRRHTLQNGVDQNVIKRLRQLEAERDTLYQGLDVVERAKVWYKSQLQAITERIHYVPLGPARSEPSLESQQEKLHFQLARIHEINAHLRALMDASDKGLPAHMNLAIRGSIAASHEAVSDSSRTLNRLKQQNKLLTEEVSNKSERITNLEREKAALLRELFQARASHRSANPDSSFM